MTSTNDGDTQYLRESGIAFLLHAAALQATEKSGTPADDGDVAAQSGHPKGPAQSAWSEFSISMPKSVRASRTLFSKLVAPDGRLELSASLLDAVVRDATKIHPSLLLRFIAGARNGTQAITTGRPFHLAVRGPNEPLVKLLEPAALLAVSRDADTLDWQRSLQSGSLLDTGNSFFHATMDVARSIRAVSQLSLKDVPPIPLSTQQSVAAVSPVAPAFSATSPTAAAPAPPSNPSPTPAFEERFVHVHIDAFVQLRPSVADGASSEMVMMLRDFAMQLEWLLLQMDMRLSSPMFSNSYAFTPQTQASDSTVTFSIGDVSFHLHAMLPPSREFSSNQLAVLQRVLESAVEADVALSRVASLAPGNIAEAVEKAANAPRPGMDPNTLRLVAIVAAEPQQFHAAQLGAAISAAINDHAATASIVNAWTLSSSTTGVTPTTNPPGMMGGNLNSSASLEKTNPLKKTTGKGAAQAPAPVQEKQLSQSQEAAPDRSGATAYVCVRRSKHVPASKDARCFDDFVTSWVRPFFAPFVVPSQVNVAAPLSTSNSFASVSPKSAATDATPAAPVQTVDCVIDVSDCPAIVVPLAALITAEGTLKRGTLADPSNQVTAFDCLADFPADATSGTSQSPVHSSEKRHHPAIYDPCVLTAIALQVSRLYRCTAKPFIVTVGSEKVPQALTGPASTRAFEAICWFASLMHHIAANAPFKKTVQGTVAEYTASPLLPPHWATMVRKV